MHRPQETTRRQAAALNALLKASAPRELIESIGDERSRVEDERSAREQVRASAVAAKAARLREALANASPATSVAEVINNLRNS